MSEPRDLAGYLAAWQECRDRSDVEGARRVLEDHPELGAHVAAAALLPLGFDATGAAVPAPRTPATIGDFRILRELGRGGMGVVYEAEQVSLRRRVALKVLSLTIGSNPHAIRRFEREARAAARLHHTNIVPIHAMGQHQGHWYYAMELVEGRPLGDVVEELAAQQRRAHGAGADAFEKELSSLGGGTRTRTNSWYAHVADKFADVADALDLAHREGVIHRDIKPGNLLLDVDGTIKIVDFGLALQPEESVPAMTRTGQLVGTPRYMSPEQARARRVGVDHRTDIYSLGATLYELLTLRPPFDGETLADLCSQIITKDPALPRRIDRRVPRDLETVVLKAMEKDAERRYRTAADFARDLRACAAGQGVAARHVGPVGRTWRRVKRHKVRSALAASVLVLAGLGAWLALRAHDESVRRHDLEYDRLIARAQHASGFRFGRRRGLHLDEEHERTAVVLLDKALALVPDRPEAWWLRALATSSTEDLESARHRGLTARTYHLTRAFLLTKAKRHDDAARERARAEQAGPGSPADDFFEARLLHADGRRGEALARLDRAIEHNSRESSIRYLALRRRASILLSEERYPDALDDLGRLLDLGDRSVPVRVQIAAAWRQLGKEAVAEERIAGLIAELEGQDAVEPWYELNGACLAQWQRDWSLRVTEAALARHPDDLLVRKARMYALLRVERNAEAEALARDILAREPASHGAWEGLGEALTALGRPDDALDALARAIELDADCAEARRARGHALLEKGRLDEALAAYEEALERQRDFAHAWTQKGVVLKRLGRHVQALAAYDHALELDPSNPSALINRGGLLADDLDQPERAVADLRRAVELAPEEVEAHRNLGVVLSRQGDLEGAAASFARAAALAPHVAEPQVTRWRLLAGLGREEERRAEIERVAAAHATDPRFLHVRGHALLELGRTKEAADCYEQALGHDGTSRCLLLDRAEALRLLGQHALALEAHAEVLRSHPDAVAHVERGKTLQKMGRKADAEESYARALELDAGHKEALLLRAGVRLDQDRAEQALEDTRQLLELDDAHAHGWRVRGLALRRLGKPGAAGRALRKAFELAPQDVEVLVALGAFVCDVEHDLEGALVHLQEACRRDPRFHDALRFRASVLNALKRYEQALEAWNASLALYPDDFRGQLQRGRLLVQLGRPGDAVPSLEEACRLEPKDAGAPYALGGALFQAGRGPEAVPAIRTALELSGGRPAIRRSLAAVLLELKRYEECLAVFEEQHEDPAAGFLCALALHGLGRSDDARAAYGAADQALEQMTNPDPIVEGFRRSAAEALGVER